MAMYANIDGTNKLLAQTGSELGGGPHGQMHLILPRAAGPRI